VGDEHDCVAVAAEVRQDLEEAVDLVRREASRGFVEDQDARVRQEQLDDLHALLLADRQLPHRRRRIDRESVAF
jgi:hypothetical protein